MTRFLFIIGIVLSSFCGQAQQHHFSLGDSLFMVGTTYRSYEIRYLDGLAAFEPESEIFLNNVVKFLRFNPNVTVEIGGHTDDKAANGLGLKRAEALKRYCMDAGIDSLRMTTADYKNSDPIIDHIDIIKMKEQEEKEAARALNQRIELKILTIDFALKSEGQE